MSVQPGDVVKLSSEPEWYNEGRPQFAGLVTRIHGDSADILTLKQTLLDEDDIHYVETQTLPLKDLIKFRNYDKPNYKNKEIMIKPNVNILTKNTLRYGYDLIPQTSLGTFTKGVATAFGVRTNANRDARNAAAKATLLRFKTVNSLLRERRVRGGTRRNNSKKRRLTRRC